MWFHLTVGPEGRAGNIESEAEDLEARAAGIRRWAIPAIAVAGVASIGFALFVMVSMLTDRSRNASIPVSPQDIVRVRLVPVPEGPGAPSFERHPSTPQAIPISRIEALIPVPLPAPVGQPIPCLIGGDLVIDLKDGRSVVYGPCKRPDTINRLWAGMVDVITEGGCRPNCSPRT